MSELHDLVVASWKDQGKINPGQAALRAVEGDMTRAAVKMIDTIGKHGTIYAVGNGGSYTQAMHFCAELAVKFRMFRRPLSAMTLPTDLAGMLAHCNDFGYDGAAYDRKNVLVRQVDAHVTNRDTLLGITTSGESKNVLDALYAAHELGAHTILLTGPEPFCIPRYIDVCLDCKPSGSDMETAHIQVVHLMVLHVLADVIEQSAHKDFADA